MKISSTSLATMCMRVSCAQSLQLCPTLCNPMDVACQALLSMVISRQEYWSGLQCPLPGQILYHLSHEGSPINQYSSNSVLSHVQFFVTPWLPCPSPTPRVYSDSCPLSRWCHPTISSSVVPCSSHLQSFSASGSFPMSQFFASSGQSIGVSASVSILPMSIQDWSPLGWTGWIFLQSKGLSRVFSNTTVQKHQFLGTQLSL